MDAITAMIVKVIVKYNIDKVVLFGSRARGDHTSVSDYDIAIFEEGLSFLEQARIYDEIDELPTLIKIQIVFVRNTATPTLLDNIQNEGILLYERKR